MNTYEGMFMIDSKAAKRSWESQVNHVKEILEKHEARLLRERQWDERKLAYEIRGNKRAIYLLTYFEAPGDSIAKINREVQLSETLMRTMILRVKDLPEEKPEEEIPVASPVVQPPPEEKSPEPVAEEGTPSEAEKEPIVEEGLPAEEPPVQAAGDEEGKSPSPEEPLKDEGGDTEEAVKE